MSLGLFGCSVALSDEDRALINNAYEQAEDFVANENQNDVSLLDKLDALKAELDELAGKGVDATLIAKLDSIATKIEESANKLDIAEELADLSEELAGAIGGVNEEVVEKLESLTEEVSKLKEERVYSQDEILTMFKLYMIEALQNNKNYKVEMDLTETICGFELGNYHVDWAKYFNASEKKLYMVSFEDSPVDELIMQEEANLYTITDLENMSYSRYDLSQQNPAPTTGELSDGTFDSTGLYGAGMTDYIEGLSHSALNLEELIDFANEQKDNLGSEGDDDNGDDVGLGILITDLPEYVLDVEFVDGRAHFVLNCNMFNVTSGSLTSTYKYEYVFEDGKIVEYKMMLYTYKWEEGCELNALFTYDIDKTDIDEIYEIV